MSALISLDEEEYMFLNERFDIMSTETVRELPAYIVGTRRAKFRKLVDIAIDSELDGIQKQVVCERFRDGMNICAIARKHGVSRQRVYRVLEAACSKLYAVLKYAYFCGFSLINPPADFEEMIKKSEEGENYEIHEFVD